MARMESYQAKAKLKEARELVASVRKATGNPSIKGSCSQAISTLDSLIDGIERVDFDRDNKYALNF